MKLHKLTAPAALLLALAGGLALPVAWAAEAEQIRTDSGTLAGYSIAGAAAPMTVLFFEPVIPAPVDPGEPHFELAESYTRATLATGPTARAVASSVWPGPLFGDGMETLADGQTYPVKADARYPQGPEEEARELPGGAGMRASARGLDVLAEATSGRSPNDEVARFGQVASTSAATVVDGIGRTNVVAAVSDVALLGGIIRIGSVRTVVEAWTDGATAATTGVTEVAGLTIGGSGFTLDQEGPRPVQDGTPAPGQLPAPTTLPGGEELREALGIEVELMPHAEATEGADGSRSAGGVRITVDTKVLRAALDELPLAELVGALPDEFEVGLYPVLSLSPKIVYILGRASVRTAGSEPFEFEIPDLPAPLPPPPAPAGGVGGFDAPLADIGGGPGPDVAPSQPQAAQPSVPLSEETPEGFGGLPPGLVALALAMTALAGYGLSGLTGLAFGAAAAPCAYGAPKAVPDLRGG